MPAVAEIVLQMDDSGVVTALQRTEGGLTKLGQQGNLILTGLGSGGTRTTAVFQRLAGAVGMVDARFIALARLGPAGIIGAIAAAAVVASQKFRSFEGAIDAVHYKLSLFQDRLLRFLGFGTSDLLAGADAIEEQKLLIPLIEKEAELRRGAASAGLEGFAALREARKQEIEQIQELANKQRELARQQFGADAGGAFSLIGNVETNAIAAANKKFDAEERALARERAKELEKLRRESFLATQQIAVENSQGLAKILNQEVLDLNASLARELELRENYKNDSISLEEERAAIRRRTEKQIAEFRRRNAEETLRMEEQAALSSLPPWQQTYAGIIVEAQQREREVRAALERTEIEEEDAARRVTAIWQEAHAQQRQALAGTLEEFASGPMEFFKRRWKQMLFQMIADTILASGTLRSIFGSIFGIPLGGGQGAGAGGGFGGGGIFGIPGLGGTPPFNPNPFASGGFGLGLQDVGGGIPGFGGLTGVGMSGGRSGGLGATGGAGSPGGSLSRGGQMFLGGASLLGGLLAGSGNRVVRGLGTGLIGGSLAAGVASTLLGVGLTSALGLATFGIGALAGFLFGFFGGPNYGKQRDKFLRNEFQPAVDQVVKAYEFHQLDYIGAISQLQSLEEQGVQRLKQLKGDGHRARDIVRAAIQKIDGIEAERQRRLALAFNPPQFHQGGAVTQQHAAMSNLIAFPGRASGGLRGIPNFHSGGDVLARLQLGEGVLSLRGMRAVGGPAGLDALNRGGAPGMTLNITIQAFDGPSVEAWLANGGAEKLMRGFQRAAMRGAA